MDYGLISPLSKNALDLETIKNDLKKYLIDKNVITDINYEGSNISVLMQIMSYLVYNVNATLALSSNQTTLLLSSIRQNIIYLAQQLGYNITRPISARMPIRLSIDILEGYDTVLIPKFTKFVVEDYTFFTQEDVTFTKDKLEIDTTLIEGNLIDYTIDSTLRFSPSTPINSFIIPYKNIENDNVSIRIQHENNSTFGDYYSKVDSLLNLTDSKFFEEFDPETEYLSLYTFFAGRGYTILPTDIVDVTFLISSGSLGNGFVDCKFKNGDVFTSSVQNLPIKVSVQVLSASSGGSDNESNDSIKNSAPLFYNSGDRTVNRDDYVSHLEKNSLIDKAIAWGGETELPKQLGIVFMSATPEENKKYFSQLEKASFIKYLTDKRIMTLPFRVHQPNYFLIDYDIRILGETILIDDKKAQIRNSITNYFIGTLNNFENFYFENKVVKIVSELFDGNDKASIKIENKLKLALDKDLFDNIEKENLKIYIPNSSKRYYLKKGLDRIDIPDNLQDLYSYQLNGWVRVLEPDYDLEITFSGEINGKTISTGITTVTTIDDTDCEVQEFLLDGVKIGFFNITLDELVIEEDLSLDTVETQFINIHYSDEMNIKAIKKSVIQLGSISFV